MTTLICDGDSWAWGSEIRSPDLAAHELDESPKNDTYRRRHIWPTLLSRKLDANVVNLSVIASANSTILMRTMNYLLTNYVVPDRPRDDVIVVVGWSSPERRSFWFKNGKESRRTTIWTKWCPEYQTLAEQKLWEQYIAYFDNPEDYVLESVMAAFQLQEFCTKFGFRLVQFNSFHHTHAVLKHWRSPSIQKMLSDLDPDVYSVWQGDEYSTFEIDSTAFMHLLDEQSFIGLESGETFKSFIDEKIGDQGYYAYHPSIEGHRLWADRLYDHLCARYQGESWLGSKS